MSARLTERERARIRNECDGFQCVICTQYTHTHICQCVPIVYVWCHAHRMRVVVCLMHISRVCEWIIGPPDIVNARKVIITASTNLIFANVLIHNFFFFVSFAVMHHIPLTHRCNSSAINSDSVTLFASSIASMLIKFGTWKLQMFNINERGYEIISWCLYTDPFRSWFGDVTIKVSKRNTHTSKHGPADIRTIVCKIYLRSADRFGGHR